MYPRLSPMLESKGIDLDDAKINNYLETNKFLRKNIVAW